MSQTSLYDDDILLWSERQAELIRAMARTARGLPNEFDIENVAEEIESVGRSEMASVESFLRLLLLHLLKIVSAPVSPAVLHWRDEARNFSAEAKNRFAPSMAQRVDLQGVWRMACDQASASLAEHGEPSLAYPHDCPFTIAELLSQPFDVSLAANRLEALIRVGGLAPIPDALIA